MFKYIRCSNHANFSSLNVYFIFIIKYSYFSVNRPRNSNVFKCQNAIIAGVYTGFLLKYVFPDLLKETLNIQFLLGKLIFLIELAKFNIEMAQCLELKSQMGTTPFNIRVFRQWGNKAARNNGFNFSYTR